MRCYFDILISGSDDVSRVVFELHDDEVPKTCQNFAGLCEGVNTDGDQFGYKNSKIHRVIPGFLLQGGDITNGDGTGGRSIFNSVFDDENFIRTHSGSGLLCSANSGPNTNCSQFYITLDATPHLNGNNIVFGKVIHGMNIIREIEELHIGENDVPVADIIIIDSGIVSESTNTSLTSLYQKYERNPEDNNPPLDYDKLTEATSLIKEEADSYFKSSDFQKSLLVYKQSLRYTKSLLKMTEDETAVENIKQMKVKIYNNSALCHMKSGCWSAVKKMASESLKVSPNNAKSNYYFALSIKEMEMISDFEDAWDHITTAHKESVTDSKITELYLWFANIRKEQKQKISKKMAQWTGDLGVSDPTAVHFIDQKTQKQVTLSAVSGGGVTYTLNEEPRGRIKKVSYRQNDTSLGFPELAKRIVLPKSDEEVLMRKIRELCSTNDVELTEVEI